MGERGEMVVEVSVVAAVAVGDVDILGLWGRPLLGRAIVPWACHTCSLFLVAGSSDLELFNGRPMICRGSVGRPWPGLVVNDVAMRSVSPGSRSASESSKGVVKSSEDSGEVVDERDTDE
jgi:hypothetical protein